MKQSIILAAILVTLLICVSCKKSIGDAYVVSTSGLYMRADQSLASPKLLLIPVGSKVTLLEMGNRATIDARPANWYKVEFNGRHGWVFGGYLIKEDGCVCNFTPGLIGSLYYGACKIPGGMEDLGGGIIPESENIYVSRYRGGATSLLLTEIAVGYKGKYACFLVADKLVVNAGDGDRIFYGMECRAKGLKKTGIIALGDVGENYEVIVKRAWGVDTGNGKIREIDPAEAVCELPCKGDECI
ncbi:MAG TPA: SH3 domain-containing protein [Spirochaetota bacterium]|nr:SH3 domain-containing protein [Spirochaetota bacterium]HOD14933.1 SH3 domain-containing protein [Spirochaetota bacterium]HPG52059.1 SH3 domain-containing protein [Spirochaetota bacterium]HPN12300.1 SH3 domain-containing protein [Spirochaetota bacterium]HQL82066.1 SH3 domain-containing protein [Spirochaetota bacterium]